MDKLQALINALRRPPRPGRSVYDRPDLPGTGARTLPANLRPDMSYDEANAEMDRYQRRRYGLDGFTGGR
jgi:hypothetical protein